jgi:NAD(P)-dependent dehydrogenase (short-subunit alcohol dehydrogenase family)
MARGTRLAGKTALIIGGTGWMGSAFSRALAAEGARIVLASRNRTTIEALAAELRAEHGVEVHGVVADVGAEPERLAREAWHAFGVIDVVLSNAVPSTEMRGDILHAPDEVWTEDYEVIVLGPMRVMRVLAPRMAESGGGSFIGIMSATAYNVTPGYDSYALAKGALWLLTKYMCKQWGKWNIRANCISPGAILLEGITREAFIERAKEYGTFARLSLCRPGTNDEVTGAAVFLASDESSYISGQCINIDGGRV